MTAIVGTDLASLASAYKAAHNSCILIDRSDLGMLKFTGETRLDLINRMSTQKVLGLQSGEGAATVLTTDIGRIIDRIILYSSSDAVYCLTGEDNGDNIARYLMRFVFFMDDFQIEDLTDHTAVLAVYGREAGVKLAAIFEDVADLPLHHWRQVNLVGATVYLHRTDPIAGNGFFVTCQASDKVTVWEYLVKIGFVPASQEAFNYLRIESGVPLFGRELTQDYIPLEANLWDDVSFNKGCYTGQEIIARMESRGRLAKKLVRLVPAARVEAGADLRANGKSAGAITSAADGPNGPLALGYVKSAFVDGNSELTAGEIIIKIA